MRGRYRSFCVAPLLATSGLVIMLAFQGAPEACAQAAQPTRWSDPATWPNHKVPVAGDKPTISNGLQDISGPKPDVIERAYTMSQIDPPSAPSSVAKMFEPTRDFQERLSKLSTAFDQVERLAKDATSAFAKVSELEDHLSQFAAAYAPVKKFQSEVGTLAQKFDPFKGIHSQLTEMSSSFRDQLHYLAAVLEPVTNVQRRLSELAATLEPVVEVKKRFQALEREFETAGTPSPASSAQSVSPPNGANGSVAGRRA